MPKKNKENMEKIKELRDKKAQIKSETKKKLDDRKAQIDAKIRKIQAQVNKDKRKKDNRRKILVGSAIMHEIKQKNPIITEEQLKKLLDRFLTRDIDRTLFDLTS